jgi:hypothetical protein
LVHSVNVFCQPRSDDWSLSDTFAGIRPADAPLFILAQVLGALAATFLFRWLVPSLASAAKDVLVAHDHEK